MFAAKANARLIVLRQGMEIVTAELSDATELARVEIESKRRSIPHLVDAADVDFAQRERRWMTYFQGLSPASSKGERRVLKAVLDGACVGYIAGHLTTRYEMDSEIQSFYVLREHQRRGIGSALLAGLADWLVGRGATSLCVGIAAGNPYRAFYLKHGAGYLNPHWMYWTDVRPLKNQAA